MPRPGVHDFRAAGLACAPFADFSYVYVQGSQDRGRRGTSRDSFPGSVGPTDVRRHEMKLVRIHRIEGRALLCIEVLLLNHSTQNPARPRFSPVGRLAVFGYALVSTPLALSD
jgi:hypothetical protein